MSEQSAARPVPGPPRAEGAVGRDVPVTPAEDTPGPAGPGADAFGDLDARPVADHVAVFEAEHNRLQRELGTIDRL